MVESGICAAVAALSALIVVGWALDIPTLESGCPGWTPVRANAAFGFGLAALARIMLAGTPVWHGGASRMGRLLALTVVLLGALTLSEYIFAVDLRIDRLFISQPAVAIHGPTRMGSPAAFLLLLLGVSLLLLEVGTPRRTFAAQALALGAGLIGLLSAVGYLNGVQPHGALAAYARVPPAGTIMVILLSVAILLARPSNGLVGLMRNRTAGGVVLRRLLPVSLLLPPLLGWLRLEAQEAKMIDLELGITLHVIADIVVFLAVSWWCARAISRYDEERRLTLKTLRKNEVALQASHALLATTERIAQVGGFDWDIAGDSVVWSEETYRMFGRDPNGYVPTVAAFLSSIHPGDRERVEAAIEASTRDHQPFRVEFRVLRPDGTECVVRSNGEVILDASGNAARMTGTSQDVTQQRGSEKALYVANALLTAQIEGSPDGILVVGPDRRIVSFNERFVELWSIPAAVVQSRSDERAVASVVAQLKDPDGFVAGLERLYTHPSEYSHDEVELKDGRVFERYSSPLPFSGDERPARIFFFRDITSRKRAEESVVRMARQDVLTGLANRGAFVESVQQAIARARRGGDGFALLYLDLDHFKDVNDTLGHPAGDLLLQQVADRLRASVRDADLIARFGGDEFAVIASGINEPTAIAALAERLQRALRDPFAIEGNEIRIGTSIGMAVYGPEVVGAEMLLSHADLALYRAKSEGRGTSCFFAEGMDSDVRKRVALVSDLREGIDAGQLFLVYQPQVAVDTGRIVGLEALVRWRHPRLGLVSPGEFIPAAETSGLIVPLGRWVARTACAQMKSWIDAGIAPKLVAVNVSGAQFRTPAELKTALAAILAETELPPERLELELTESVLMEAWLEQRDILEHLRESGIKLAIDDFGTGFSSLEYLSRFPVDRLKIAQSFIADLGRGRVNEAIVRATIGLGRELELQVIAEGVETREQLDLLRAWGCGEVQGFYFARPLPADEVENLLRKGSIGPRRSPSQPPSARRPSGPPPPSIPLAPSL